MIDRLQQGAAKAVQVMNASRDRAREVVKQAESAEYVAIRLSCVINCLQ